MFSHAAIVIGLVHSYLPYTVLTCYLTLQAIDDSIIDAARSLGASRLTVARRLVIPLAMPGITAGRRSPSYRWSARSWSLASSAAAWEPCTAR